LGVSGLAYAGPQFVKGKSPGNCSSEAGSAWFLDLCVHLQLVLESNNFTRSSVPLIESLKSNAHLIIDVRKRKNLTHLQSILLFKDSSVRKYTSAVASPAGDVMAKQLNTRSPVKNGTVLTRLG